MSVSAGVCRYLLVQESGRWCLLVQESLRCRKVSSAGLIAAGTEQVAAGAELAAAGAELVAASARKSPPVQEW